MGIILDTQISQNASYASSISIPASTTPALFGTLGLDMTLSGANPRVELTATVTLSAVVAVLVPVTITIFRNVDEDAILIYSATQTIPVGTLLLTTSVMTAVAADVPPAPGFFIYQAFVSIPGGLAVIPTRVGPESFVGVASSD
ncbi:hypothetical protein SY83_05185 [Paenibacillus swuensis]|uniref:Uncharacterized protein n=1 Tax=Paenibacillus swuensis TaxID=1178515 RepID=A0A172TFQ9_9BACL|nr:hypothetical protein [Paenibacillus swuensis]ANE45792.1 hypothetical protein SY83_05185 [Paenibacillus swuensis]